MGKAIGIDFGTTNTVVSYRDKNGQFRQLKLNGKTLIPSILFYNSKDDYAIGQIARAKLKVYPAAGLASFKSLLADNAAHEFLAPNGDRITQKASYITSLFLGKVFDAVQKQLYQEFGNDGDIDSLLITVPTGFTSAAKDAIQKAALRATRLEEKQIRREFEPTAAAFAAMQEPGAEDLDTVLVYDFGGGTFDISLIKREGGIFREIARGGDERLGGNDLTRKLMAELLKQVNINYGTDFPLDEDLFDEDFHGISLMEYKQNMQELFEAANRTKEDLSEIQETDIFLNIFTGNAQSEQFSATFSRQQLERLFAPEILKTVDLTTEVLQKPEALEAGKVDRLILAGGTSRIPMIRELLHRRFPDIPISLSDDASTIISCGAAILAEKLEDLDHLTSHVTSHRLGVSATEGMQFNKFQPIIAENQPLPCEGSRTFSLGFNGQRMLDILFYQYDVLKNPRATSVEDDAFQLVDLLHIDLPPNLEKSNTFVDVRFVARKDGSMDISAQIRDRAGKLIGSGEAVVNRESEVGW